MIRTVLIILIGVGAATAVFISSASPWDGRS
jgi:hypothetical protein